MKNTNIELIEFSSDPQKLRSQVFPPPPKNKMSTLGRKAPSISGSRASIYSHASTVRTLRTQGTGGRASNKGRPPAKLPWWRKPIVHSALYTDLQRGSWHIGFYTLVWSLCRVTRQIVS